ncbi:helix-turn-helix domain-containing protein [Pseudostreptobacillus hongkongensis]|uniref:helix-turn-helix domain-containing protein n=1 Tax=Pseudostreptobacillus hongkongensis TaxID=1162717 RepID=UPI000829726C|nr:helix-turn-helix transcriptional regulator [Pseudostreptobacillus hongkongensis]
MKPNETNKLLGNLIKTRRMELGISQQQLSEMIGYNTKSSISYFENGQRTPGLDVLEKLAKALNVSLSYFFPNENKKINNVDVSDLSEFQLEQLNSYINANTTMFFDGYGKNTEEDIEEIKQTLTRAFIHILKKQGKLKKK